jgi:preprotein translocase subunit Sec61beta
MSSNKSARQKRRSSDGMAPLSGAGLIRFYSDQSNGIKVSPTLVIALGIIMIVLVILAHNKIFSWLFSFGNA